MKKLSNAKIKVVGLKNIQLNAYFAHPENILLCMLADADPDARRLAVNKILNLRGSLPNFSYDDDFEGGDVETDENGEFQEAVKSDRAFCVPKINIDASVYYRMVNLKCRRCH